MISKLEIGLFILQIIGVMTRPFWTMMSKLKMFENCISDSLENSNWLEDRVVCIPSSVPLEAEK